MRRSSSEYKQEMSSVVRSDRLNKFIEDGNHLQQYELLLCSIYVISMFLQTAFFPYHIN
jgi:hypothetical protein